MLGPVLEDVEQCRSGLTRCLELMRVVAVGEDRPAVAESTMRRASHANREPLHAAREGLLVRGFDDQVQVIGLHREVHDAKGALLAGGDRAA